MIPEMDEMTPGGDFIFQQDGARSHISKSTVDSLDNNLLTSAIFQISTELTSDTEIAVHFHFPLFFIPG